MRIRRQGADCLFASLFTIAIATAAPLSVAVADRSAFTPPRPLEIDDIFEVGDVDALNEASYRFSPDGRALAISRERSMRGSTSYRWRKLYGMATGDIWFQPDLSQAPINITHGADQDAGWWSPSWSPGGGLLAALSTASDDNVTLWVWNRSTGNWRQLTQRGVDLGDRTTNPVVWLDDRHVLCPLLPEGEKPWQMHPENAQQQAIAAWKQWAIGTQPTSSILESGIKADVAGRPQGQLLVIDAIDGSTRALVPASTRGWRVSTRFIGLLRQASIYVPSDDDVLRTEEAPAYTVEVVERDGRRVVFDKALPTDVLVDSLRWSPEGHELIFLSFEGSRARAPALILANAFTRSLTRIDLGDLDLTPKYESNDFRSPPQIEWISGQRWLARGMRRAGAGTARRDWWVIDRAGDSRAVTADMPSPPAELHRRSGSVAYFGLADGDLWRLDPNRGELRNLTANFDPIIAELSWPRATTAESQAYSEAIFSAGGESYHFDFGRDRITPTHRPSQAAAFVGFEPNTDSVIHAESTRSGTFAWRGAVASSEAKELFSSNLFLRDIAEGEFRAIEYTALSGQKLSGWVILPVGYVPGKRYPLITFPYPGAVQGAAPPKIQTLARLHSLNMQIPAARGYAVLLPSIPLKADGAADDPMLELSSGVLPAVDAVIELGIADPRRLYLLGQSFGGFSTYGLITQTDRFAAAIASAGLSNLISLYGQFDVRWRYTNHSMDHTFMAALMESGQVRMGAPPWKDYWRYLRNSPLFYMDRVKTPLLIIQGDMDFIALQQGEEVFSSLYRQGKRAKFVRYWGEGHSPQSPANIHDMWARIFDWLESFPSPPSFPVRASTEAGDFVLTAK